VKPLQFQSFYKTVTKIPVGQRKGVLLTPNADVSLSGCLAVAKWDGGLRSLEMVLTEKPYPGTEQWRNCWLYVSAFADFYPACYVRPLNSGLEWGRSWGSAPTQQADISTVTLAGEGMICRLISCLPAVGLRFLPYHYHYHVSWEDKVLTVSIGGFNLSLPFDLKPVLLGVYSESREVFCLEVTEGLL